MFKNTVKTFRMIISIIFFYSVSLYPQAQEEKKATLEIPANVSETVSPLTVKIICNPGDKPGSGVIIGVASTSSGNHALILTACHVISSNFKEDAGDLRIPLEYYKDIQVTITNEVKPVPARVIESFVDRANDIAVITAETSIILNKVVSYTTKINKGQKVAAFGFPLVAKLTQTTGTIIRDEGNFFVFDARIAPGNSGGPVVNTKGLMVGMTLAQEEETEGYAIKMNLLETVVNNWLKEKSLKLFWQKKEGWPWWKYALYVGVPAIPAGYFGAKWLFPDDKGTIQEEPIFGAPPGPPQN